jgi:hypothetical protein
VRTAHHFQMRNDLAILKHSDSQSIPFKVSAEIWH